MLRPSFLPAPVLPALVLTALLTLGCEDSAATASTSSDTATASDASNSADTASSADTTSTAPAGLTQLAKASAEGVDVELWSAKPLVVGWQKVFYRIQADGKAVTEAEVAQKPLMKMTAMQHACPLVQPAAIADAQGLFAGELMFQMAGNAMESWQLDIEVTPKGGTKRTVALGKISVGAAPYAKVLLVGTGMTAERYTVIVHFPAAPKVGLNPYRVALHRASSDMMTYEPVSDASLQGVPEMPSMGHGSPGNVNPSSAGGGFYDGKLNFTMPGDWRLNLAVSVGGKSIGTAVFDWML
jgi:hypothetical protein